MKTTIIVISAFISLSAAAGPNLLNIYLAPPERVLDWSNSGAFYTSLMKSRLFFTKRPLGSAGADLVCEDKTHSFSVDPQSFDIVAPIVFQGKGHGFLFSAHPGKNISGTEAVAKNKEVINTPGARYISFLLNSAQCGRILTFWNEFEKNNIARNYGLPHRPLMGEGATDTSLVVSTLEVAGLLVAEQREKWERVIFLPKNQSGEPLTDNYVFVFSLLSGNWGKTSDDSFVLRFWDPELIAKWIDQQIASKKALKKLSDGNKGIVGVVYDLSKMPVPQGTFWEQALDSNYSKPVK